MDDPTTPHRPVNRPDPPHSLTSIPPSQVWATMAPAHQDQVFQLIVTVYRTLLTVPTATLQLTEVSDDSPTAPPQ